MLTVEVPGLEWSPSSGLLLTPPRWNSLLAHFADRDVDTDIENTESQTLGNHPAHLPPSPCRGRN